MSKEEVGASHSKEVSQPSTARGAVFLSYASQDAAAAQKICEGLRAAGIEVWFDQSELRGGEAWDRSIRQQIHDCRLFIAVISANSETRDEGYFRREWKLAVDRTHDMDERRAFLVPVVIDATSERGAHVPEKFHEVQWTRLPGGETPSAFVERVNRLLSPEASTPTRPAGSVVPVVPEMGRRGPESRWPKGVLPVTAVAVVLGAAAYLAIERPWISKPPAALSTPASAAPAAFAPPPHSVAVLPFVNMSGEKEQEYFSDGLTEELLNSLAEINELQVAARTSAFSFKGQNTDIGLIARKLNVGAILEGSVRRSGNTVRITAQLVNAVTGFHLWSKSYDRDLGDVLKLQTEIATAVAGALKVALLGDISQKIELGGTRNAAAFDAYLRALKAVQSRRDAATDIPPAIAMYTEAIRLDPNYALAFAGRSMALTRYAAEVSTAAAIRADFEKAESDARQALALASELSQAHTALASVLALGTLDFVRANEEHRQGVALAPGNAQALRFMGSFSALMGHFDEGIAAARRAVVLDPLNRGSHITLGDSLYYARRSGEAATAYAEAISLSPDFQDPYAVRGLAFYELRDLESARGSCETKRDYWKSRQCLAVVYEKLGRHADAEAELKKMQAASGDASAYQYATIYAQWGDRPKSLEWLDTATRLRDPGLIQLKTDPLMDPLRQDSRFQAVMRKLNFPN